MVRNTPHIKKVSRLGGCGQRRGAELAPLSLPPSGVNARLAAALLMFIIIVGSGLTARGDTNLVWSDEFNGTSLNTNVWTAETGNAVGADNGELEYYTGNTQNVYVANGLLHIVALRQPTNGFFYTSARITTGGYTDDGNLPPTPGYFAKLYGHFEFRVKMPKGVGLWPAIWLMPENERNSPYGSWPACGEIDVFENDGAKPTSVQEAIHFGGGNSFYAGYGWSNGDSVTNFHVYSLDWTSNAISWSVDGHVSGTATNWWSSATYPYPAPFNTPFHLIMNLAVGGSYLGNPGTNAINGSLPGEMLVDYVRVYDHTDPLAISIARANGSISLSWPTNIVCHLQSRTNLDASSTNDNWIDVEGAPNPFIVLPSNGSAFYRLVSP